MKLVRSMVLLFAVTACDPGGTAPFPDSGIPVEDAGPPPNPDAGPGLGETTLLFVNLIDDDPTLDVQRTVGARVPADGPPIGAAIPDIVLEGTRTVRFAMRGDVELGVTTTAGRTTLLVATGDADDIALDAYDVAPAGDGGSRLQLIHTSPSLGTLNVVVRDTENDEVIALATGLAPGAIGEEIAVPENRFFHLEMDTDGDGDADLRFASASGRRLERILIGELEGIPYVIQVQGERGFYPSFATGPARVDADVAFVNLFPDVAAVDVLVSDVDTASDLAFGGVVALSAVPYDAPSVEIVESGAATLISEGPLRYFGDSAFMIGFGATGARDIRHYVFERDPMLPAQRTCVTSLVHLAPSLGPITLTQTTTVPPGDLDPGDPYPSNVQEGDVFGVDTNGDGTNEFEWTIPALTPAERYVAFLGESSGSPRLVLVDRHAVAQTLAPDP